MFSHENTPHSDTKHKIEHFVQLLGKNVHPTVKDYQWMMGYSDFPELQLFWKHCYTKLDSAPLHDDNCFNEMTTNWLDKDKSPSYYLQWLQKQLPENPKLTITSLKKIKKKNKYIGTKVQAMLNNVKIVFWVPTIKEDNVKVGNIQITSINGVPLNVLLQQESEASVLFALGMKTIVRPQTKIERAFENKKRQESCKANPECVKRQIYKREQNAIHEKEMKQSNKITKIYKAWCEENITVCESERTAKQENFEIRMNVKKGCSKDFDSCITKVSAWYDSFRGLKNSFCRKHSKECIKLDKINQSQLDRYKVFCKKKPKDCEADKSSFDRALLIVKRKLNNG